MLIYFFKANSLDRGVFRQKLKIAPGFEQRSNFNSLVVSVLFVS